MSMGLGTAIATKGSLVTRDIDVLSSIQMPFSGGREDYSDNPNDELSRWIEPCAPSSSQRLEAAAYPFQKQGFLQVFF